ncbi:hypothetical protein [Amycolatopsis rubida]|uniref:Uncharacterized protein n=1 Tax=Amycolatopsis rubida TaxID=112413 RepID=A0A1I5XDN2_9PSEU|nr:hypothetical protein [Amycolatopsis rubida]SFQ30079.1 hypothetical protein SAMN05421854_110172 [Amycolatopsis rubida]
MSDTTDNDLSHLGNPAVRRGIGLKGLMDDDDDDDYPAPPASRTSAPSHPRTAEKPRQTAAPPTPEPRSSGGDGSSEKAAPNTGTRRAVRGKATSNSSNNKTLYTSYEVKTRLTNYRYSHRVSILKIILKAIEHAAGGGERLSKGDLGGLKEVLDKARIKGAFDFFAENPNTVRYQGGGSTPSGYKPTPAQFEQLQKLTEMLGFSERSTWLAPILDNFLPPLSEDKGKTRKSRAKGAKGAEPSTESQDEG